jgi:alkylation response protein AidB-like acyl-CoA dehydrogenase
VTDADTLPHAAQWSHHVHPSGLVYARSLRPLNLVPSDEQNSLAEVAASFVRSEFPIGALRKPLAYLSPTPEQWLAAAELGLFGIGLPESAGGVGFQCSDETVVFNAMGAVLAPISFLATLLAAHAAHLANAEQLPSLLSGQHIVGLADPAVEGCLVVSPSEVTGEAVIFDTASADVLLVRQADKFALVVAPQSSEDHATGIDTAVRVRKQRLDVLQPLFVGESQRLPVRDSILVSAMLSGIAMATADMSVRYATIREQFGRPIGGFQAIKHRCAEMATRSELAFACAAYASVLFDEGDAAATITALSARATAADSAIHNARDNIQNHGGIGFTFEHDAHLFVRRAHLVAEMYGGRRSTLDRILESDPPFAVAE